MVGQNRWVGARTARVVSALAVGLMVVGLVAGCTQTGAKLPPTPPTSPLWFVGDSLSTGTGFGMGSPRPFVAGYGAAGFTDGAITTILGNTQQLIDQYGAPKTVLALGGVNDLAINATIAQIIAGMTAFEDAMNSQGATVVWVMEPAWARASQFPPLNDWIRTRSHYIDCLAYQGNHLLWDADHPENYLPFSQCVATQLLQMTDLVIA